MAADSFGEYQNSIREVVQLLPTVIKQNEALAKDLEEHRAGSLMRHAEMVDRWNRAGRIIHILGAGIAMNFVSLFWLTDMLTKPKNAYEWAIGLVALLTTMTMIWVYIRSGEIKKG